MKWNWLLVQLKQSFEETPRSRAKSIKQISVGSKRVITCVRNLSKHFAQSKHIRKVKCVTWKWKMESNGFMLKLVALYSFLVLVHSHVFSKIWKWHMCMISETVDSLWWYLYTIEHFWPEIFAIRKEECRRCRCPEVSLQWDAASPRPQKVKQAIAKQRNQFLSILNRETRFSWLALLMAVHRTMVRIAQQSPRFKHNRYRIAQKQNAHIGD